MQHVTSVVAKGMRTHPGRAYQRYTEARGNVLAGGIAYFAFFSVFPAVLAGLTVLGLVMAAVPQVRDPVVAALVEVGSTYLSGLLKPGFPPAGEPTTGIYIDEVLNSSTLNWALVVSLATLAFTGLGWIDGMRQGIRAVFGEDAGGGFIVLVKLRDLLVLVVIGVGVLLSVSSVLVTKVAAQYLLELLGAGDTTPGRWLVTAAGFAVSFALDTATFLAVFRILPGADVPLRQLLSGAVLGGVGLGVLKQFGTGIAQRSAEGNALAGAAASVIVLLVLMNLMGRLILWAAAWAATTAEDAGTLLPAHGPAKAQYDVPLGPRPVQAPSFSPRAEDRTTLAAGVVLGALGAGAAVAGRAVLRSVLRRG
nr:YihY/virulence factor BrkB family protein [Kineococcus siccus]